MSPPRADLGSGDEKVKKVDCRKFLTPGYTTSGHVELYTVSLHKHTVSLGICSLMAEPETVGEGESEKFRTGM